MKRSNCPRPYQVTQTPPAFKGGASEPFPEASQSIYEIERAAVGKPAPIGYRFRKIGNNRYARSTPELFHIKTDSCNY